jgi:hypothetical protein
VFADTYASIVNCETNGSMAEWLMAADCKSAGRPTLVQIQLGPLSQTPS